MGEWVDLSMIRYLSFFFFIEFVLGNLIVQKGNTLMSFDIITKSYNIVTVSGVWHCTDDYDCILEISWKDKKAFGKIIYDSTHQKISKMMETVDNMNNVLRVIDIKNLINVVNEVDRYSFIGKKTKIELRLESEGSIIKEKLDIMKLITNNGGILSISDPPHFVKMVEKWEKQKPKRNETKKVYIPMH